MFEYKNVIWCMSLCALIEEETDQINPTLEFEGSVEVIVLGWALYPCLLVRGRHLLLGLQFYSWRKLIKS